MLLQVVMGARVTHHNLLWWGLGYRTTQSWMLSAGLNIHQKLSLGYAFDIYSAPISSFDGGHNVLAVLMVATMLMSFCCVLTLNSVFVFSLKQPAFKRPGCFFCAETFADK